MLAGTTPTLTADSPGGPVELTGTASGRTYTFTQSDGGQTSTISMQFATDTSGTVTVKEENGTTTTTTDLEIVLVTAPSRDADQTPELWVGFRPESPVTNADLTGDCHFALFAAYPLPDTQESVWGSLNVDGNGSFTILDWMANEQGSGTTWAPSPRPPT